MNFWDLYWPMAAALVSTTLLFESIHLALSIIVNQKQLKKLQEQTRTLMEQGGPQGFPGSGNLPFALFDGNTYGGGGQIPPTTSGKPIEHGHYL